VNEKIYNTIENIEACKRISNIFKCDNLDYLKNLAVENKNIGRLRSKGLPAEIIKTQNKLVKAFFFCIENSNLSNNNEPLLHIAARNGDKEVVKYLLQQGNPVNITASTFINGWKVFEATPLHLAIAGEHHEILEILINAGANINAICFAEKNKDYKLGFLDKTIYCTNFTPLILATFFGQLTAINILCFYGADLNACFKIEEGDKILTKATIFQTAALGGNVECINLLEKKYREYDKGLVKKFIGK
jgi:ankyrin repeat protein